MKRNIIIGLVFVVSLILVGYISFTIGSKTVKPKIVETVIEKEPNIEEIKESIKTEIYEEAYNEGLEKGKIEGYEKGKTEVFELMLESETTEEKTIVEVKPTENKESTNKETAKTEPTTENQPTQPTENQSSTQDNICPICGAVIIDSEHVLSHGYTNDDGTNTIHEPTLSASNFTWSVSQDGSWSSSEFFDRAMSYITYYDYDYNTLSAISGIGITVNPNGPGTYELVWSNSSGNLTCTQYVTLTE